MTYLLKDGKERKKKSVKASSKAKDKLKYDKFNKIACYIWTAVRINLLAVSIFFRARHCIAETKVSLFSSELYWIEHRRDQTWGFRERQKWKTANCVDLCSKRKLNICRNNKRKRNSCANNAIYNSYAVRSTTNNKCSMQGNSFELYNKWTRNP